MQIAPPAEHGRTDNRSQQHRTRTDSVNDRSERERSDSHGAAEGHEPQRHHSRPLAIAQVLLEDDRHRSHGEEIEEPEQEPDRNGHDGGAGQSERQHRQCETTKRNRDQSETIESRQHRSACQTAQHRSKSPGGVEPFVCGRTRLDAEAKPGHRREEPDKR